MKIAFVMPFYTDDWESPEVVLERYPLVARLPVEVARRGHMVRVLCQAPINVRLRQDGVGYEFFKSDVLSRAAAAVIYRRKPRYGPAYFEPAWRLALRVRRLRPDVIHFFGLTMDVQLALTALVARAIHAPLVVHFHGGMPDTGNRYRHLQHWNCRRIDRVLFTTPEQAESWIAAGMLTQQQSGSLIESSSPFNGIERAAARAITGMYGDPVCLSVGTLTEIKDPLTMLRGFARVLAARPRARLYMYYTRDDLLATVRDFIDATPGLAEHVELRGRAPLAEMEAIYSSADFLLQASLREWSGLAIMEALSCGCIPVVTDIPSFRALTANGRYGRLFPIGDDGALAEALLAIDKDERESLAKSIRGYFVAELSFAALARQLDAVYTGLVATADTQVDRSVRRKFGGW